jgi:hypothetical protein
MRYYYFVSVRWGSNQKRFIRFHTLYSTTSRAFKRRLSEHIIRTKIYIRRYAKTSRKYRLYTIRLKIRFERTWYYNIGDTILFNAITLYVYVRRTCRVMKCVCTWHIPSSCIILYCTVIIIPHTSNVYALQSLVINVNFVYFSDIIFWPRWFWLYF